MFVSLTFGWLDGDSPLAANALSFHVINVTIREPRVSDQDAGAHHVK
jgi:hypothetical protein